MQYEPDGDRLTLTPEFIWKYRQGYCLGRFPETSSEIPTFRNITDFGSTDEFKLGKPFLPNRLSSELETDVNPSSPHSKSDSTAFPPHNNSTINTSSPRSKSNSDKCSQQNSGYASASTAGAKEDSTKSLANVLESICLTTRSGEEDLKQVREYGSVSKLSEERIAKQRWEVEWLRKDERIYPAQEDDIYLDNPDVDVAEDEQSPRTPHDNVPGQLAPTFFRELWESQVSPSGHVLVLVDCETGAEVAVVPLAYARPSGQGKANTINYILALELGEGVPWLMLDFTQLSHDDDDPEYTHMLTPNERVTKMGGGDFSYGELQYTSYKKSEGGQWKLACLGKKGFAVKAAIRKHGRICSS